MKSGTLTQDRQGTPWETVKHTLGIGDLRTRQLVKEPAGSISLE